MDVIARDITSNYEECEIKGISIDRSNYKLYLMQYIASNEIHVSYAKSIIRKIASNKLFRSSDACLQIVNSGYTEEIFKDIAQDIYTTLIELIDKDDCYVDRRLDKYYIVFAPTFDKEGQENGNAYKYLYQRIQRTLDSFSNVRQCTKKGKDGKAIPISIINYDGLYIEEGENPIEYAITSNNPNYINAIAYNGGFTDLINNQDFTALLSYIRRQVKEKRYLVIEKVVIGLIKGMKNAEIVEKANLSIDTVKKARQEIKELYSKAKNAGLTIDIDNSNKDYMWGNKTGIDNYSNGYTYIGQYSRNELDKPIYQDVKKVTGKSFISMNYSDTFYDRNSKISSYVPSIGCIELSEGITTNTHDSYQIRQEGKKVYSKHNGCIEVWNYIKDDNGYIISKELLRTYPIYKGNERK